MRTLTRIICCALLLLAVTASPARAAVPPDEEAWILGSGLPVRNWVLQEPFGHTWTRSVTVRSTGAVEGRPGNRHTATFEFRDGYKRFPIFWTVRLTDEQCDTSCVTLWAGEATRIPQTDATWDPIGSDGAVHVRMPLRGDEFEPAAPFTTSSIDVTVTPQNWSDPRATPDLATLPQVSRTADTTGAAVFGYPFFSGDSVTATGRIAGVPADQVLGGSWSDYGYGAGDLGSPLSPAKTLAQQLPYAPPLKNGRFTGPTGYALYYTGIARGSLTTTTGVRLRGNTFRLDFFPELNLGAGAGLVGQVDGRAGVVALDCPTASTPLVECAEVGDQLIGETGRLRYAVTPFGSMALQIDLPVTDGSDRSLGALRVLAAVTPTGAALPERSGTIDRQAGSWLTHRALQQTVRGPVRLGNLPTTPDFSSPNTPSTLTVRVTTDREGSL